MPTKKKGRQAPRGLVGKRGPTRDRGAPYHWPPDGFGGLNVQTVEIKVPRRKLPGRHSLGLHFQSKASVVEQIKRGFAVASLERLSQEMQVTTHQLAEIASIAKRTLARRRQDGRLQALESEKVYRIAATFDRAVQVLGGSEPARRWLKTPKKAFRGRTPLQHCDTEVGAREVEDLLGRLEHGVFS